MKTDEDTPIQVVDDRVPGGLHGLSGETIADPTLSPQAKLVLMVINGPCGNGGPSEYGLIAKFTALREVDIPKYLAELGFSLPEQVKEYVDRRRRV